jgi:hypothetical protein
MYQPQVFQYQPTLDASASLVNLDRSKELSKKFKPEDLPDDLREYE